MKKLLSLSLFASLLVITSAITSLAQCEARKITLSNGNATINGKTGGCQRFSIDISEGQRVRVSVVSTDNRARFVIQNGSEDDTGTTGWGPIAAFDKVLDSEYWEIGVSGTSSVPYTLKITVSDD